MRTVFFRIVPLLISVFLLYGCAVIDKQLLVPASQHAKVNPLFRTADCKDYKMPTRGLIREIFMPEVLGGKEGGFFIKDPCEHQVLAINDFYNSNQEDTKTAQPDCTKTAQRDCTKTAQRDDLYQQMCSYKQGGEFTNPEGGARNCLNYLISKSNEICELHKSHIYGDRTVSNTILGTLALGAGIAGTMTGASAAHYLAGSAGFLTGSQALMDKEIYRNFVFHAILLKIDANRSKFLKSPGLAYLDEHNDDSTTGYAKVRNDAVEYHNLCSFYDGLKSLMDEAGVPKTELTNPLLLEQTKLQKQLIENKIKELEAQLLNDQNSPEEKKKIAEELKKRKGQLFSINERLVFMGEKVTTPDGTGEKTDSEKKTDGNDIKGVQSALKKAGFDPGPIDGIPGTKTLAAIKAFQKANRLIVTTGELNPETLNLLAKSNK